MDGKLKKILRPLKYLAILLVIFGVYFYFSHFQREALENFYLKFDQYGITAIGRAENNRKEAIDALAYGKYSLRYEQREALKNRTVFLGATDEMVILALGKPTTPPTINERGQQVWVYYFDDYNRPTYLYFSKENEDWVLISAEKTGN